MASDIRPVLIALEGPAGSGKTTLAQCLRRRLDRRNLDVGVLPEFSTYSLGRQLAGREGSADADRLEPAGLSEMLLYLADRVGLIEATRGADTQIWIADRFLTSQFVLGLAGIHSPDAKRVGFELVTTLHRWGLSCFAASSIFVFLDVGVGELRARLARRPDGGLERPMDLEKEHAAYHELATTDLGRPIVRLNSDLPRKEVASQIEQLCVEAWAANEGEGSP